MNSKPREFDEAICLAIGRGVWEVVKIGDEISVFSLLEAIESFIERQALSERSRGGGRRAGSDHRFGPPPVLRPVTRCSR